MSLSVFFMEHLSAAAKKAPPKQKARVAASKGAAGKGAAGKGAAAKAKAVKAKEASRLFKKHGIKRNAEEIDTGDLLLLQILEEED
jgi:hypothetical protein